MARIKTAKRPPDLSVEKEIGTILVIRLKALGDIALSLPIVRSLRKGFPRARIFYLCKRQYAEVLAGETSVDRVIVLPDGLGRQISMIRSLRRMKIDMTLDLLCSPRTANITFLTGSRIRIGMDVGRHAWCYTNLLPRVMTENGRRIKRYTFDSNLELVRLLNLCEQDVELERPATSAGTDRYAIGFPAAAAEREWADRYVSGLGLNGRRLVGVVPVANYQSKSWPREYFILLMNRMFEESGLVPVVLWGKGEEEAARAVADEVPGAVLAPPTSIARLGALIAHLDMLVTPDSGPKHLAVLQGVPTLTLFGPTDPEIWDPMNDIHRVLRGGASCSPCRKKECVPNSCLSEIEPDTVLNEILDLLGSIGGSTSEPGDLR
ncbi:MAG: glycosyltransferase family 9 protein [Candidatus Krumholzibacteria bacterium]|nr:glycosyltransferase family 9 protein [Candidatus Krumholzibacteria bacterium]